MTAKNKLIEAPPYSVEQALRRIGENLSSERIRRRLAIEDVARNIGARRRARVDAENGKASTVIGVYLALLWAYDLLHALEDVANPNKDEQGLTLAAVRDKKRARKSKALSNDF